MTWRSVRLRLTALVVIVATVAMLAAATLGVSRIRDSLVDDVVEDTAAETLFFDGVLLDEGFAGGIEFFDEFPAGEAGFIVDELEDLTLDLDQIGAVDALLAEMGRSRADGLPVLHSFGVVVVVGLDGAASSVVDIDPVDFSGPMAFEFNLFDIASAVFELSAAELLEAAGATGAIDDASFEELTQERLDDTASALELETATAEFGGLEFVVVADVTDVSRSVDRMRSVLWLTLPLLVALAAGATWILTGRALAPVRQMSRRVDVISGGTLHERVPVPRTGDEIEELGSTMNAMLDRLEADDRRVRQFVSDASHELRSPVAVLRSEAEVALRSSASSETTELAHGVLEESLRLDRIVADLLVLARGDEDRATSDLVAIDLDDIVLAEAARRRRVPIDIHGVSAGRVRGTREGCERVLVHLLDNAARHAEAQVAVTLAGDGVSVTLVVDDDGPGIPVADRDRVFERFTRLEAARTRDTGGAGLGLPVVAATVAAMGGKIDIERSPLGGARFRVVWPSAS